MLSDALQRLYAEHAAPTHCSAADVDVLMLPILDAAIKGQHQVLIYRRHLATAKRINRDPEMAGLMEKKKMRLAVMEQDLAQLHALAEKIADSFTEWSRLMDESQQGTQAYYQRERARQDAV